MRRRLALVVIALTMILPTPADAAPCPSDGGVTVVVDASALGGEVSVSCVTDESSDGIEALRAAGHTITPTQAFSEFVCRIDGQPSAEQDPCVNTPPASAFWSYWQAEPGESWAISQTSAYHSTPRAGGAEGWSFGSGDPPSVPPRGSPPTTTTSTSLTTAPDPSMTTTTIGVDEESDTAPGPWPTVVGLVIIGVLGSGAFIWTRKRDHNG